MTPKEKAKELVEMFLALKKINPNAITRPYNWQEAKQCSLICIDEIIKATQKETINKNGTVVEVIPMKYWVEVKKEIEKF